MSWVWVWPNFKISLVRGSYELPIEQIKQTVNANHGQPVSQLASKPASESVSQRAKHPASQPASESVSQSASQSVKWVSQSDSQPTDQPTITLVHGSHEQPIEQTTQTVKVKTNQLTSQPASQGTAEQTYITTSKTKAYDPPCLAYFIVRMRRRIQKVALKSFKFGYVQVETPKFPRPCTLACNCKIILDSEFDKVWVFPRKFQSYPVGEASKKIMLNF